MPSIAGIDLSDGVKIILGDGSVTELHLNAAAIRNYNTPVLAEDAANKWFAKNYKEDQIRVHVFSLDPLKVTCIVANWRDPQTLEPIVIPDNWWE